MIVEVQDDGETWFCFRLVSNDGRCSAWGRYKDVVALDDKVAVTPYHSSDATKTLTPITHAEFVSLMAISNEE